MAACRAVFRLVDAELLELLQLFQRIQLPKLLPLLELLQLLWLLRLHPAWGVHFCVAVAMRERGAPPDTGGTKCAPRDVADLAAGPALSQLRDCHGQP